MRRTAAPPLGALGTDALRFADRDQPSIPFPSRWQMDVRSEHVFRDMSTRRVLP
jgi:hypothetical protein